MMLKVIFKYSTFFFTCFIMLFWAVFYFHSIDDPINQQFSQQAQSFIHGRLDIPRSPDTIDIGDKHYWHQAPFPSLILIPPQLIFGSYFNQIIMLPFIMIILSGGLYKLARLKQFSKASSAYLVYAFVFGSFIFGLILAPFSWLYAQLIATSILTLFLLEFETRRRFLILGVFIAMLVATRPLAALSVFLIPYLLLKNLFCKKINLQQSLKKLFIFSFPILVSVILLLLFNYLRFGSVFVDTYALFTPDSRFDEIRDIGIFSLQHIPSNIYYYFLISVQPVTKDFYLKFPYFTYNYFGTSFFIVCPFFIYAFKTLKLKTNFIREYWVIIFITLFILLTFFGIGGYRTFGPRYMADFLPILFLLLLYALKPPDLTNFQKSLIIFSSFLNFYLLFSDFIIRSMGGVNLMADFVR